MSARQVRHWCFTLNNYLPEDITICRSLIDNGAIYCCFQPEIGASGTAHIQGFVSFQNGRLLGGVRRAFHRGDGTATVHLEAMRGTAEQAIEYCSKDDTRDTNADFAFEEYGTRPRPGVGSKGGRSDVLAVGVDIKSGKGKRHVFTEHPDVFIRYHRGIEAAIALVQNDHPRDFKTEVFWYWGPTGTGKSRKVSEEVPVDAYWKSPEHSWWDGYYGQEVVVLDDYRCDFCKFSQLLRIFDRYPLQVQVKGSTVQFLAKKIYVTSPRAPLEMWENRNAEDLNQLARRIEHVLHFPSTPFTINA